jgi:hypothetical protein
VIAGGGGGGARLAAAASASAARPENNTATGEGGGILIENNGSVTISDSAAPHTTSGGGRIANADARHLELLAIYSNTAALDGGGIESWARDFTILDTNIYEHGEKRRWFCQRSRWRSAGQPHSIYKQSGAGSAQR